MRSCSMRYPAHAALSMSKIDYLYSLENAGCQKVLVFYLKLIIVTRQCMCLETCFIWKGINILVGVVFFFLSFGMKRMRACSALPCTVRLFNQLDQCNASMRVFVPLHLSLDFFFFSFFFCPCCRAEHFRFDWASFR